YAAARCRGKVSREGAGVATGLLDASSLDPTDVRRRGSALKKPWLAPHCGGPSHSCTMRFPASHSLWGFGRACFSGAPRKAQRDILPDATSKPGRLARK